MLTKWILTLTFFAAAPALAEITESSCNSGTSVSYGNGHLSAVYDSKSYDLELIDGRKFEFTANGTKLKIVTNGRGQNYNCQVARYGHSWGKSEMGFSCSRLGKSTYIRLFGKPSRNTIVGEMVIGPDEGQVQVFVNWQGRRADPEISSVKFKTTRYCGWMT